MPDPVFFKPVSHLKVSEVADRFPVVLRENGSDPEKVITGMAPAYRASSCDITFVDSRKNRHLLDGITAAAVFVPADLVSNVPSGIAILECQDPARQFAALGRFYFPAASVPVGYTDTLGISEFAKIASNVVIEDGATIEHGAVIGNGAAIGSGTIVAAHAVIGPGCQIGRDCYIGPSTTIQCAHLGNRVITHPGVRIGQDGFGFVPGPAGLEKVPQIGRVIIQDDVEIGANTTIDRGAMDDTVIGEGTKIDNLVQIAHNVKIGRCCAIAAHTGLSGSVTLGDYVMLGGRVGIADHITVGSSVMIAAGSGVMQDIPNGGKWGGVPAVPIKKYFRQISKLRSLAEGSTKKGNKNG